MALGIAQRQDHHARGLGSKVSQLQTYDVEELSVINLAFPQDVPTCPGQEVCHVDLKESSYGVIIAIDDHHASVLWSREPTWPNDLSAFATGSYVRSGYVFAPYVPLIVTPTIFAMTGSQMPVTSVTGSIQRYAKKLVNHKFFSSGSIF